MKTFLGALLGVAVGALTTVYVLPTNRTPASYPTQESVFDRVMRTGTFRCGVFPWPPAFTYDENTHEIGGASKPFYDAVMNIVGLKTEYVLLGSWGTYVEDMKSGKVDGMCNDGPYTPELAKLVDYSRPWQYAPIFVFGRTDQTMTDLAQLDRDDIRFVGIDGDISIGLKNILYPHAKLVSLPGSADPSQLFLDVMTGKADVVLADLPLFQKFNAHNPDKLRLISPVPATVYPVGISVLKGETKLLDTINVGIESAIHLGIAHSAIRANDPTGAGLYEVAVPYKGPSE